MHFGSETLRLFWSQTMARSQVHRSSSRGACPRSAIPKPFVTPGVGHRRSVKNLELRGPRKGFKLVPKLS
eukprot:10267937-Alexandrium_andersonii.AAC.1